jgi:hypothetical protein
LLIPIILTNLWKATGSVDGKKPQKWFRNASTEEFIQQIQTETKRQDILLLKPGRYGGTFGHWKLGLAYTEFFLFSPPHLHSQFPAQPF